LPAARPSSGYKRRVRTLVVYVVVAVLASVFYVLAMAIFFGFSAKLLVLGGLFGPILVTVLAIRRRDARDDFR
jgi:hypothetical protein